MGSGPRAGLAELRLPELQKGSSIMPGKVNPVIPEVVIQVAAQVIGNDAAITIGGMQGQFELNVRVPLIARNLLDSIKLLASASRLLDERCVSGVEANEEMTTRHAESTLATATALNPHIGYDRAAEIVKEAAESGRSLREVAIEKGVEKTSSTRRSITARWPVPTTRARAERKNARSIADLRPYSEGNRAPPPFELLRGSLISSSTLRSAAAPSPSAGARIRSRCRRGCGRPTRGRYVSNAVAGPAGAVAFEAWSMIVPKRDRVPSSLSKSWSRRLCLGQSASAATRMLQKPPPYRRAGTGSTSLSWLWPATQAITCGYLWTSASHVGPEVDRHRGTGVDVTARDDDVGGGRRRSTAARSRPARPRSGSRSHGG